MLTITRELLGRDYWQERKGSLFCDHPRDKLCLLCVFYWLYYYTNIYIIHHANHPNQYRRVGACAGSAKASFDENSKPTERISSLPLIFSIILLFLYDYIPRLVQVTMEKQRLGSKLHKIHFNMIIYFGKLFWFKKAIDWGQYKSNWNGNLEHAWYSLPLTTFSIFLIIY